MIVKKIAFLSGALFTSLTILGFLFEIMYWEFGPFTAGFFYIMGFLGLATIFVPSFAMYHYKKDDN